MSPRPDSDGLLSLASINGSPLLRVQIEGQLARFYPRTNRGYLAAGRDLHAHGVSDWVCLGEGDAVARIRYMVQRGYNAAVRDHRERVKTLFPKMVDWCRQQAFLGSLTEDERRAFAVTLAAVARYCS